MQALTKKNGVISRPSWPHHPFFLQEYLLLGLSFYFCYLIACCCTMVSIPVSSAHTVL